MTFRARSTVPFRLAFALATFVAAAPASAQLARKVTRLADSVFEIRHRDSGDGFAGGNTTVIIGERQVFVVDAPFLPSDAREDMAQIRQWTDKPVSFLLNTHFHNDHNFGNRAYMDAFPALTIISHVETKKDMDLFGPGSLSREESGTAYYQHMLDSGKGEDGKPLTEASKTEIRKTLDHRKQVQDEMRKSLFQSATLTFDHDFTIDLGGREVQVKFLGRGNTSGDAVVFLPKEKIAAVGDLVVYPMPFIYDGYPSEWIHTLDRIGKLDASTIVPGHGSILHDTTYVYLLRDFMQSAVTQLNEALRKTGPAMFHTVDDVKAQIDLSPFRTRFAGDRKDFQAAFDDAAAQLIIVAFREASHR